MAPTQETAKRSLMCEGVEARTQTIKIIDLSEHAPVPLACTVCARLRNASSVPPRPLLLSGKRFPGRMLLPTLAVGLVSGMIDAVVFAVHEVSVEVLKHLKDRLLHL